MPIRNGGATGLTDWATFYMDAFSKVFDRFKATKMPGGGTLVTLSSWVAHRGASMPDGLAYAATKSAIAAVTLGQVDAQRVKIKQASQGRPNKSSRVTVRPF